MKHTATPSNADTADNGTSTRKHGAQFMGVRDSRNRRIPGLYTRNGRFYGQLWMPVEKTARKFALVTADGAPVQTLNEAKLAMEVLREDRRNEALPTLGRKPALADYVETYFIKAETKQKKPRTQNSERQALKRWAQHLGDMRIDRLTTSMIASYRDKRLHAGTSPRTVNLDQIALRSVLKRAVDDGHLLDSDLRALKLKNIKTPPAPKRPLMSAEQFEALLAAVPAACAKNAVQCADYLRFLAFTGAREVEALAVRWADVDFTGKRVTIGHGGVSKNRDSRAVDFNPKLAALLAEMHARRAPDCSWVFPSPQRGPRDEHAKTFRESLRFARKAAGLEWVGFHDLRHRFASVAVMAGVDFMTIAGWLGHKDGGILVGKVYGHLSDKHKAKAAAKLRF